MPSSSPITESVDVRGLVIGVLELQGDFAEHTAMLRRCGVGKVVGIRQKEDLTGLDGVILPGGESTAMSKLLVSQDMLLSLQKLAQDGLPFFGTCAGCILLAGRLSKNDDMPRVGVLDVCVDRNYYGSQIDSFEALVDPKTAELVTGGKPLRVVHIRAPSIAETSPKVRVLASYRERPILVQQGAVIGCTFHPELTLDTRVHMVFLRIVAERKAEAVAIK